MSRIVPRIRKRVSSVFSVFMALAILLAGALVVTPAIKVKAVADQWEITCSDSPSGSNNYLFGTAAQADDAVVAVGSKNVSGTYKPLLERWEQPAPGLAPCFKEKSNPSVTLNSELLGTARVPTASLSQRPFWAVGYQGATSRAAWDEEIGDWVAAPGAQTLIEYSGDGGQTWGIVSSPNIPGASNILKGVSARSDDDAWAVGYSDDGTGERTLVLHWDGTSWSIVPSPNQLGATRNYLYGVSAVKKDDAWAVGFARHADFPRAKTFTLRWNGLAWTEVPSGDPGPYFNYLFGVAGISTNQAHTVGAYFPDTAAKDTLALLWNGTAWSRENTPSPGVGANVFYGISPLSAAYIWAVGSAEDPPLRTLTARRVNGVWTQVASPNASSNSNELRGVTVVPGTSPCAGGNNWAVGYYVDASGMVGTLAMRYYITPACDLTP